MRRALETLVVSALACLALPLAASAGKGAKPEVAIVEATSAGRTVTLTAQVTGLRAGHRLLLERRNGRGRWAKTPPRSLRRRRNRLVVRWRAPSGLASVGLRLRIVSRKSGRTLAVSQAVTVALPRPGREKRLAGPATRVPMGSDALPGSQPGPDAPEEDVEFVVPATTRLYQSSQIGEVISTGDDSQAEIEFAPGVPPPPVGGHVALGPKPHLPDGMFARVLDVTQAGETTTALVEQAPIDEVLDDVHFDFDGDVAPTVVDEEGMPVTAQQGTKAVLRAGASFTRAGSPAQSAFECEDSSNVPRDASEMWETGLPFPVEIVFQNTHAIHRFDAGSIFPARDPSFLLQFSGEAIAKVGFEPKAAFKCALSPTYRRNHRLHFRVGSIGPVPVSINLEPSFEFEVSASGEVSFGQKHHFSITLEKNGFAAPDFRLGHSADPPQVNLGAKLEAELFAGGDLSVMAGGGYGSANAQAGIFGAFGPEISASIAQDKPACVALSGRLKADLGVRFELWVKRWDFQLASLSTKDVPLADPVCAFGGGSTPPGKPVDRSGDPQPFEFVPQPGTSSYLTLPAADGWWLTGEQSESGAWQYQWLDPAGNPSGDSWTGADEQLLSFARGEDGAIIAATMIQPESDLRLTRIGADGPETERIENTNPYAPFVQRLAGGVGGHIYLFARLGSSPDRPSSGTFRLDPLSLETTGYRYFGGDNPGIVAHQNGVTTIDYTGYAERAPYSSFGLHPPDPPVVEEPTTHSAGYTQFSVGEGGDIADVDLQNRECGNLNTSVRHLGGASWTQPLSTLVEGDIANCEMVDVDAMPDGAAAYTLRGDSGIYILTADPSGERASLTQIGPFGLNPTSVVDAAGTVVTAFTERFDCAEANQPSEQCSRAVVTGEKAGQVIWSEPITAGRQTMMPFTGFVGRPSLTIGRNQVGVQLYEVDPNSCGSDNCTPFSATALFRTLVKPLEIGLRPSFVWW